MKVLIFSLLLPLLSAQDILKPVGVKITRPGVIGIAGTPPVGDTLVTLGYSWESPASGTALQGLTSFSEYRLHKYFALLLTTTEPLHRDGRFGVGDTSPGLKIRSADETRYRPLLAASYSLKVPLASTGFGTGRYDHKLNLAADKGIGRTRYTANFVTTWAAQKDGAYQRQYMPALSAMTRWHSRWGSVVQSYWTTAGKHYGGVVGAPFIQVNRDFNVFAGAMRNLGPCTTRYGVIAGLNYMHHRPR